MGDPTLSHVYECLLEPTVSTLGTERPLYDALRKGFAHLDSEDVATIETRLTEHEIAMCVACYNIGFSHGLGIKQE